MTFILTIIIPYLLAGGIVFTIFYYLNKYIPVSTFILFLLGVLLIVLAKEIRAENIMQEIIMALTFVCATIFISSAFIVNEIYTMRKVLNKKSNEKSQK